MPFYAIWAMSKSLYYPIKDIYGSKMCFIATYIELFLFYLVQFQTFFITLYRYICLFHDDFLFNLDIHPKSLAKFMVITLFIISFIVSFSILSGTETVVHLESCLGNYWLQYDRKGQELCGSGSVFAIVICKLAFVLYLAFSSNILESYLLYKCFKKIQKQTESVQSMIDQDSYHRRRRYLICLFLVEFCLQNTYF